MTRPESANPAPLPPVIRFTSSARSWSSVVMCTIAKQCFALRARCVWPRSRSRPQHWRSVLPRARCRRDDHRVARNEPCHVDQPTVGCHVLHPDRRRMFPGEVVRMLHCRGCGNDRLLAVDVIQIHRECGDGRDLVADCEPGHALADRLDCTRGFIAEHGPSRPSDTRFATNRLA